MRILLLHSDYLEFEVKKKAVKDAEEFKEGKKRAENVLVCFMSIEKIDEKNPSSVVEQVVKEIGEVKERVNAEFIALYPYAHLSDNLARSSIAKEVLKEVEGKLREKYEKIIKAPFGWYKSFSLKCKGHPLSELSRTILPKEEEEKKGEISEALVSEEKLKSYWYILTPEGKLVEVKDYDFSNNPKLKSLATYEMEKVRAVDKTPPHVELMRKLELVDYEPGSDPGNLRYYPKGRMIKALLEEYVGRKIREYGGLEVESPIMYDFNHPTLASYLHRFPARQYTLESDKKKYFLRFAACFGQFLIAHDMNISYRNLPLRLYEMTRYSFRREKSGELTGLRRLRAFTMPDVHAICADLEQAMEEYKIRFKLCLDTLNSIGLSKDDFQLAIRVTKEFYEQHKEFVEYLVKTFGKAALVEMWDERKFYFILKYEFNFVDALNKASALSTDQIDVENGERYDIRYMTPEGVEKHPIILHCSPSGAIERVIYALLEKAYMEKEKGGVAMLPLWLAPTQIRLIPLSAKFLPEVEGIAEKLKLKKIRVDIDDRNLTLGKKISDAEKEWIPYIGVVGEKEVESGKIRVRIRREKGNLKNMSISQLAEEILKEIKDLPFRELPLPLKLSQRPKFVG